MKAKRDNIISELITLRITKAKAKENVADVGVDEIHLKIGCHAKKWSELISLKKRKRKRKNMSEELISL